VEEIILSIDLLELGDNSFSGCINLKNISIPKKVRIIGNYAFEGCKNLKEITIPSSVSSIGEYPFEGCDSLATISVDENNLAYTSDNGVLLDNMGKIIQFPKGWIGNYTIPNVVTSVDERVFSNCHGLTSINISSNMINIENKAFSGCNNLERINVDDLNPVYKSVDGVLFDRENDILLECPEGFQGTINIPKGTTTIGRKAFKDCSRITAITIPSSVNEIEDNAFEGCSSISELNIEDGVKVIGRSAFSGCYNIKNLGLPSSVVFIDNYAFSGCKNLVSMSYEGLFNPCPVSYYGKGLNNPYMDNFTGVFEGCDSFRHVCVPLNYKSNGDFFCGTEFFCLADSCEDLNFTFTTCSFEFCYAGDKITEKSTDTLRWERHSSACVDYLCKDEGGFMVDVKCLSTNEHKFICTNDGCLLRDQLYSVEIDFDNLMEMDVNLGEITMEIEALTGIDELKVGVELDEDAYVVHVVVLVDDENVGEIIVDAVNNMDRSESCSYGTVCMSKFAKLIVKPLEISEAITKHTTIKMAWYMMMMIIAMIFISLL